MKRYFILAMLLAVLLLRCGRVRADDASDAADAAELATAMRNLQARLDYLHNAHLITDYTYESVVWPACITGTPAPSYPSDTFYTADAGDPDTFVADVASVLEAFGSVYWSFAPDPEGQLTCQTFQWEDFPGVDVEEFTPANSHAVLAALTGAIGKLQHIYCSVTPTPVGSINGAAEEQLYPEVLYDALAGALGEPDPGDLDGPAPVPTEMLASEYSVFGPDPVFTDAFYAFLESQEAVLSCDTTGFTGIATVYLQINPFDTSGNEPPGLADFLFHSYDRFDAGTNWLSTTLGGMPSWGTYDIQIGWALKAAVALVTPDFDTSADDKECCNCNSGSNSDFGSDMGASCSAGGAGFSESSLHMHITLGKNTSSAPAGDLYLRSDIPSPSLSTVSALHYSVSDGVTVIPNGSALGQILTPLALVDFVIDSATQYEMRFYHIGDAGSVDEEGFYVPTGAPYKTITVANPDSSGATWNQLNITETADGSSKLTQFIWTASSSQWEMITGAGARHETLVTSTAGAGQQKTRKVKDSAGNILSETIQVYQTFAWGRNLVQQSDGDGLTTYWDYYSNSATDGYNYGKLKQVTSPTGSWELYTYDSSGRVYQDITQYLDGAVDPTGASSRMKTNTYSDDGLTQKTIETLQGQEIGRHYTVKNSSGQTQDIVCTVAGASSSDTSNLVTTTQMTWDKKVQSILRPDGALTLYDYSWDGATTTSWTGKPSSDGLSVTDGTETITVTDGNGNQVSQTVKDIASTLTLSTATTTATDEFGRPTEVHYDDGSTELTSYNCCGVASRTDREGITTAYTQDALGHPYTQTRAGITTIYAYDAAGRLTQTTRQGSDGSTIVTGSSGYDPAGNLVSSSDPLNNQTTISQTITSGHTVKTTTYPDGSVRVDTYYSDGSLLSSAGSAVHPSSHTYGVDADGVYDIETIGSETTKTSTDLAGRVVKIVHSGGGTSFRHYNGLGQLDCETDPDGVTTLHQYNAKGEEEYTATSMTGGSTINFSGSDRITHTVRTVVSGSGGATVQRTIVSAYETNGSAAETPISQTDTTPNGLNTWSTRFGLTTRTSIEDFGDGTRFQTTYLPDNSYQSQVYLNDRLVESSATMEDTSLSSVSYTYDSHGRLSTMTDERNGTTTYTYTNADQIATVTTPVPGTGGSAQTTTHQYDSMGRENLQTLPGGAHVHYDHYPTGELEDTYGDLTYTTSYTYDSHGRIASLTTSSGATTWNYDSATGYLTSKLYADGNGTHYTYTSAGRIHTRVWQRGITTTYGYNGADDLISTGYSDSTPGVSYTLNRLGQIAGVTDAAGSRTLTYAADGQPATENFSGGLFNGLSIQSAYDSVNRQTSVTATLSGSSLNQQAYGYDGASRLSSISSGLHSVAYTYTPHSNLIQSIAFSRGSLPVMTTTRNYDNLNRLTSIGTVDYQGNALGSFGYTYNALNQRSQATAADATYWTYGYDALGQVISGQKYWSNGTAVEGQGFGYTFDGNGNRTAATINGHSATYSPTSIDQYTQRTVPGYVEVSGTALASASVLVNGTAADRQGGYYFEELSATNTATPVFTTVTAQATISGSTNTLTGHVYTPQTPEAFTYDTDGNLTQDGRWNYTWDAENRLIGITPISTVPAAAKKTLQFAYDYMGRRISKSAAIWNTSTGAYRTPVETRFIYDGWNLVAETDNIGKLLRNYVWGTDLSGTPQGAGGIGGLLMVSNAGPTPGQTHTYFPTYDGNGNITSLVKSTDVIPRASYEYGPFGEILRQSGEYATINPFRFSTKYEDEETGLDYYGYRFYDPATGRWINRDPIEERSGANLYALIGNEPIDYLDLFGLDIIGGDLTDKTRIVATDKNYDGNPSFQYTSAPNVTKVCRWEVTGHLKIISGGSSRTATIGPTGASQSEGDSEIRVYVNGSTQPDTLKITVRHPAIAQLFPPRLNFVTIAGASFVWGDMIWKMLDQFYKPLPEVQVNEAVSFSGRPPTFINGQGESTDNLGQIYDTWAQSFYPFEGPLLRNQSIRIGNWTATIQGRIYSDGSYSGTISGPFQ